MTNEEAKELLAHKLRQLIDNWDGTEESKLLGDALAVPGRYVCGACGCDTIYSDDLAELKFCENCGQALDWSEAVAEEME